MTFVYFSLIEVGDFVERDEEIATIETDKVNIIHFLPFLLGGTVADLSSVRSTFRSMLQSLVPSRSSL